MWKYFGNTGYRDNDNHEQGLHAYYHDNIEEVLEWLPPEGNGTPAEQEEHGFDLWDDWMRIYWENYRRLFLEY
jgi:hypothetical protein